MFYKRSLIYHGSKEKYLTAFLLGFLCIFVCLLPVVIADGGYFIFYGDYNAQQIPFYILANNAVRDGQLGWNWFTDLGSDFLTSYSFYLSGSPFFWLSALLPRTLITISMPVLLSIKHGLAAMTAYAYIRRFVRNKNAAVIGGLLYAFSGFQIFNVFFNHFQDVTSFFPLMLIAMEEHINNGRKGVFALTVALMSIINYFFFTGQAVFLVIYFLIRLPSADFKATWKKFFTLAIEAVLGTMIGGFILLPSALTILGNYRVSEHLFGQDMVLYSDKTRIPRIIQTFFMPVDVPARPNLFNSDHAKWASIGGYLPLFSMVGVITFMKTRKKHWATRTILLCIICAFIPILNSAFYTFNGSYYARWFYMPILIMAMMTAHTLDDEDAAVVPAFKICAAMLAAFLIISVLPRKIDGKIVFFQFPRDFEYFMLTFVIAAVSLAFAGWIFFRKKRSRPFMNAALYLTCASCIACMLSAVLYGAASPDSAKKYVRDVLKSSGGVYEEVSDDNFFRIDISENCDNYPMAWGLPSIRAFQSVVSTSIMDFYDEVGVQRDVASRPELSHYTLRGLLSVKYFYCEKKDDAPDIPRELPGFEYIASNDSFDIYENKYYIGMGFGYSKYISESEAAEKGETLRERLLINALVLSDEQIEKYSDILTPASEGEVSRVSTADYLDECTQKQQKCSSSFKYDSYGFESEISLSEPQLVFFSVPYSEGWTAKINGKPADVEKVSYGFMAVKADAGDNVITFKYATPGLKAGALLSLTGAAGLIIYLAACHFCRKRSETSYHIHSYDYTSAEKISAADEYSAKIIKGRKK